MTADKLKLFHEEIMQEEQINYSELPIIIKKQIKGFNLLKSKLEKKPDEKLFLMLQNRAIKIGDSIQNFVENDYEEEEEEAEEEKEEEVKKEEKPKQEVEKKSSEVKKSNTDNSVKKTEGDTEKKIRQPRPVNGKFGNFMMEKKILSAMELEDGNKIKISVLETIIGKEPNYPEQEVHNITLRKIFLSNYYRLI
jgi:hypothetical protein